LPSLKLPKPEHWQEKSAGLACLLVILCGLSLLCAVWTVILASRGAYLTAAFAVGLGVFPLGLALGIAIGQFGWISVRGTCDSGGTVLRPDRVVTWVFGIAIGALIPSGLVFIRYVPTGGLDIPLTRGERIFFPFGVAFIVFWAGLALISARSKGGFGYLKLTPDGFEVANVFFTTASGSWADVVEISDEAPPKNRERFPVVMIMKDGSPQVITGANGFTPRGNALYWMIRHYWLHLENRIELTDGRALERLRSEQFEVE
jgi:hypothetical protein